MTALSNFIKARREGLGLSLMGLSKISGVPKSTIGCIECGINQEPKLKTLYELSKALAVPIDDLANLMITEKKMRDKKVIQALDSIKSFLVYCVSSLDDAKKPARTTHASHMAEKINNMRCTLNGISNMAESELELIKVLEEHLKNERG